MKSRERKRKKNLYLNKSQMFLKKRKLMMVQNHLKHLETKSGFLNTDYVERGKIAKNSLIFLLFFGERKRSVGGSFIENIEVNNDVDLRF